MNALEGQAAPQLSPSLLEPQQFEIDYTLASWSASKPTHDFESLPHEFPVAVMAALVVRAEIESSRARAMARYNYIDNGILNSRIELEEQFAINYAHAHELDDAQVNEALNLAELALMDVYLNPTQPFDLWRVLGIPPAPKELPQQTQGQTSPRRLETVN